MRFLVINHSIPLTDKHAAFKGELVGKLWAQGTCYGSEPWCPKMTYVGSARNAGVGRGQTIGQEEKGD